MGCIAPTSTAIGSTGRSGIETAPLSKQTAYERLDGAGPHDYVMGRLDEMTGQRVEWFAVTHAHPDHRHVHVVARTRAGA